MRPAPNTLELDEHLQEIVNALHRAVSYTMPHVDDPEIANKAIQDCKEILSVVMEGNISEWLQ